MFIKNINKLVGKINVNEERETISIYRAPREFGKVLNSLRTLKLERKHECFNQSGPQGTE